MRVVEPLAVFLFTLLFTTPTFAQNQSSTSQTYRCDCQAQKNCLVHPAQSILIKTKTSQDRQVAVQLYKNDELALEVSCTEKSQYDTHLFQQSASCSLETLDFVDPDPWMSAEIYQVEWHHYQPGAAPGWAETGLVITAKFGAASVYSYEMPYYCQEQ
jgi:hypothetical protein